MASEQNDRRELYKQYATEQLALESAGLEMQLINVKEYEKTVNLIYVDKNRFCDMLARITVNKSHHIFLILRKTYKQAIRFGMISSRI